MFRLNPLFSNRTTMTFAVPKPQDTALIVVDMQRDFVFKSGSLYVPDAERLVSPIEELMEEAKEDGILVITTADWHPANHISFLGPTANAIKGKWPPHCIQYTSGADIVVKTEADHTVFKGQGYSDGYSGFKDTTLNRILSDHGRYRLLVCGVAGNYCVDKTIMDGIELGYEVHAMMDYIKWTGSNDSIIETCRNWRRSGVWFEYTSKEPAAHKQ